MFELKLILFVVSILNVCRCILVLVGRLVSWRSRYMKEDNAKCIWTVVCSVNAQLFWVTCAHKYNSQFDINGVCFLFLFMPVPTYIFMPHAFIVCSYVFFVILLCCFRTRWNIYPNHMQEQLSLHGILWIDKRKNPIYFSFKLFITSNLNVYAVMWCDMQPAPDEQYFFVPAMCAILFFFRDSGK